MRLLPTVLIALATTVTSVEVAAQTEGSLPRSFDLPASTRAMGLGGAYMMNARQADAIFYHPSLLRQATGFGVDFQRWGSQSSSSSAAAATSWLGGGVGVGLLTLQYGAPGEGVAAAPAGQDHLFELGRSPVSERVATVGLARRFFGIDFGLSAKLVEERIADARDAETQFDMGASREVGPLTVGLTVRDLGKEPVVGDGGFEPGRVLLGVGSYGWVLGPLDVGVAAAADIGGGDTVLAGGVEVGYWPIRGRTFVGRVGVMGVPAGSKAGPFSFGFAFWGDNLVAEWAFVPVSGATDGGTHRFGLHWR